MDAYLNIWRMFAKITFKKGAVVKTMMVCSMIVFDGVQGATYYRKYCINQP